MNPNITALAYLYCNDCSQLSTNLSKTSHILLSTKQELYKYMNHTTRSGGAHRRVSRGENKCFGCANSFLTQALELFMFLMSSDIPVCPGSPEAGAPTSGTPDVASTTASASFKAAKPKNLTNVVPTSSGNSEAATRPQPLCITQPCYEAVRLKLVEIGMISELFQYNIHRGCNKSKDMARTILCALTKNDQEASHALTALIEEKVMFCLRHHTSMDVSTCIYNEMLLLIQTAMTQNDDCFNQRMGLVLRVFHKAIEVGSHSLVVTDHIIQPCLQILSKYMQTSCATTSKAIGLNSVSGDDRAKKLALKYATKWMALWMQKKHEISQSLPIFQGKRKRLEDSVVNDKKRRLSGDALGTVNYGTTHTRKRTLEPMQTAAKRRAVQSASGSTIAWPCDELQIGWFQKLLLSQCSESIRKELVDLITSLTEGFPMLLTLSLRIHNSHPLAYSLFPDASPTNPSNCSVR